MDTNTDLDEIKRLLLKKLSGDLSEAEEELLNQWINASPQNETLARRISSKQFLTHAILDENEAAYHNSWQRLRYNIKYTQHFLIKRPQRRWLVAAMLTGLLFAGSYFFGIPKQKKSPLPPALPKRFFTPPLPSKSMHCPT